MVNAAYLWENIKKNKEILKHSIKKTQYDTVSCMAICQYILIDYENVDENIYQELINLIYSNVDIARTVLSDSKYEGYSYLMLSLFNNNLKLTEAQKKFAVREAMNKKGTTYFNKLESDYRKRTGFDKDALDFNMTIKEKEQALISRYFDYLNNI